jgi:hypothetical protein
MNTVEQFNQSEIDQDPNSKFLSFLDHFSKNVYKPYHTKFFGEIESTKRAIKNILTKMENY